jgi:hypothetical protein
MGPIGKRPVDVDRQMFAGGRCARNTSGDARGAQVDPPEEIDQDHRRRPHARAVLQRDAAQVVGAERGAHGAIESPRGTR